MRVSRSVVWVSVVAWVLICASIDATTVMQLNLAEMVQRADRIYRGTVVSASAGTIAAGGGQLPVVTYRLQVEEVFRGDFTTVKGVRLAEIRTLGKIAVVQRGNLRSASPLPRMPEMVVGQTYLVFTTQPSTIGLSTTVGLGQGCFRIARTGKDETALNEVNNGGLFRDMAVPSVAARTTAQRTAAQRTAAGPLTYAELASQIQSLVRR